MLARIPALALTALLALSTTASSQTLGVGCPETKSRTLAGSVVYAGRITRCGGGIKIFGIRIALFGPECPDKKLFHPTREICEGDANEGTMCIPFEKLEVTFESCKCGSVSFLGTGIATPDCNCTAGGVHGYVQGYETTRCPDLPRR